MSEESLSALLDGECTAAELRSVLSGGGPTPQAMKRWGRMCQVREVLAGGGVQPGADAFCSSVISALQREAQPAPVRRLAARPQRRSLRRWQPLMGLAAAASIAAVAVVGARHWLDHPVGGAATLAAAKPPAAVPVVAQAAAPGAINPGDPDELRWAQLDADTSGQLNEYVLEHSNLRAGQGMGGSLSYARMINTPRTLEVRSGEPH